MQRSAAIGHRAISAVTALAFGGGLALYQMTSLVLVPSGPRQLHLSLSVPSLDRTDRADPVASNTSLVLGSLAPAVKPAATGRPATRVHRIAARPTPASHATGTVTVSPVATPTPRPSDHPRPRVAPTPEPPRDGEGD
ncbi:MAG TPA: hypothetical protein VG104_09470 [Candidatus Dormibacteraeota bacterium]|nr:hypothetical protein [Candidatus Dormibacteraeota bacterium]